jgi:hypothetical protein
MFTPPTLPDYSGGTLSAPTQATPLSPQAEPWKPNIPTFDERLESAGINSYDRYVLDAVGKGRQNQVVRKGLFSAVNEGQTTQQIGEQADLEQAMDALNQFVAKTAGQSSEKYNQLRAALEAEVKKQVEVPKMQGAQAPNIAQAIFMALGAMANPNYAFDIGKATFDANIQQRDMEFANDMRQYEADMQGRKENIGLLGDQLDDQRRIDERNIQLQLGLLEQQLRTAQGKEAERIRMKIAELEQEGLNNRARLAYDRTELGASNKVELKLLDGISKDRIGGSLRAQNMELLRDQFPEKYGNLTDDQIASRAGSVTPGEGLTVAKTETENKLRKPRIQKVEAEIGNILARTAKTVADTDLVRLKTDLYDDEFAVRAANAYSQIAARAAKSTGTPADVKAQIGNLEAIARLSEANLKKIARWDPTQGKWVGEDQARVDALRQEIVTAREEAIRLRKAQMPQKQGPPAPMGGSIPPFDPMQGANIVPQNPPKQAKPDNRPWYQKAMDAGTKASKSAQKVEALGNKYGF